MENFASCLEGAQVAGSPLSLNASTERLWWKDYFRDPSQRWVSRKSKTNPRGPVLKHKLWMDSCYNVSWIENMLLEKETQQSSPSSSSRRGRLLRETMLTAQEEVSSSSNNYCSGGDHDWEMLSLEEVLSYLEEGTSPETPHLVENLACILHKCRKEKNLGYALRLHAYLRKTGMDAHRSLGNLLVSMLVDVGSMCDAQHVFEKLVYRNECSWNSLITGYTKCGELQHALILYQKMQEDGSVQPSRYTFVAILKACAKLKDLERGCRIHAEIARKGTLETDLFVGSTLVDMYAKCGLLAKAQQVFDKLSVRDAASWNALISGYAKHRRGEEALNCFEKMQCEGVSPNAVTYVCILKACGSIGAIDKGGKIHAEIGRKGLLNGNLILSNALINMYGKCGSLAKAQEVFDKLPVRDVVSWNALMAGYAQHEHGEEALNCFKRMQKEGISPDSVTLACSLKACGSIRAADKGQEIHVEIARKGLLKRDVVLGNALVAMYAKCGLLANAQEVFDKLPVRDIVSWNTLMTGYANHGHGEKALYCFEKMQVESILPNAVSFVCSLKACGSIRATDKGREIHAEIARQGLEKDLLVGSTLVDMYAKCGLLAKAQEVFDKLVVRDAVSWNALIAGYSNHGHGKKALNYLEKMQQDGFSPDVVTFVCSLRACGSIGATDKGREIHSEIARKGLLERHLIVGNALVDMYAKCGSLANAQEVFDQLLVRDVVSWNALIAGYAQHECGKEALNCFEQMQHEGVSPDAITYVCILKACGSIGAKDKGQEIHAEIASKGLLERDLHVGSSLVDMYAKCGFLDKAQEVFDELPVRDVVSWNALIAGYATHDHGEEALNCLEQMQCEGIFPDAITFVCSLKACGSIGATDKGQEIHAAISREGLWERDLVVGNALVDMYAKCGLLAKAREAFDRLPVRDIVSWNALIAGYAKHEFGEEALICFEQLQHEDIFPDAITLVCILKACGSIGATDKGQELHAEISRNGLLERNLVVGSTLVDMYAKCGLLAKAQEVFDKLPVRDLVSWNALITGYAQVGESENVFLLFDKMVGDGKNPNLVTFVSVLNSCSHAGLVDEGQTYFEAMIKDYGIIPDLEHYSCMIDLLGRTGQLDKAVALIKKMPFCPNLVVWHTVLGACRKWGNVELGRQAFQHAVQLDEKDAAAFICLANIYTDADMQEDANKIEAMRVKKQAWEMSGYSLWTDADEIGWG